MSITSNMFFLFCAACLLVYYLAPKKVQWMVLLLASYLFYIYASAEATFFLIFSTVITWGGALWIEKQDTKAKAKRIFVAVMLLDLAMLAVLKYTNFFIGNINQVTGAHISYLKLLLPLGISYYTFQSLGYLLDVYWKRATAEKNLLKYALFLAFFPQLIQGPIGRYGKLREELYAGRSLDAKNLKFGTERVIWGLFKKMLLADWAAIYADAIFADPDKFAGIAIFGTLLYTVELYGNFSGGIDIVLGISEMFGIHLDENFRQPFFAKSISDFWQRWHISLGTWMKDYVFYPLTLSKAMKKCGKTSKKLFGKKIGRNIPVCISNLIVFFVVGIWHGPTWSNITWGLYNGVIIAFSGLFAGAYASWKKKLHINDKSRGYLFFMMLRTFILINISWYFDCVSSLGQALKMMRYSVTRFQPSLFLQISSGKLGTAFTPYALTILGVGVLILFVVDVLTERGLHLREEISRKPLILEFVVFMAILICVGLLSPMAAARGFIYAQF